MSSENAERIVVIDFRSAIAQVNPTTDQLVPYDVKSCQTELTKLVNHPGTTVVFVSNKDTIVEMKSIIESLVVAKDNVKYFDAESRHSDSLARLKGSSATAIIRIAEDFMSQKAGRHAVIVDRHLPVIQEVIRLSGTNPNILPVFVPRGKKRPLSFQYLGAASVITRLHPSMHAHLLNESRLLTSDAAIVKRVDEKCYKYFVELEPMVRSRLAAAEAAYKVYASQSPQQPSSDHHSFTECSTILQDIQPHVVSLNNHQLLDTLKVLIHKLQRSKAVLLQYEAARLIVDFEATKNPKSYETASRKIEDASRIYAVLEGEQKGPIELLVLQLRLWDARQIADAGNASKPSYIIEQLVIAEKLVSLVQQGGDGRDIQESKEFLKPELLRIRTMILDYLVGKKLPGNPEGQFQSKFESSYPLARMIVILSNIHELAYDIDHKTKASDRKARVACNDKSVNYDLLLIELNLIWQTYGACQRHGGKRQANISVLLLLAEKVLAQLEQLSPNDLKRIIEKSETAVLLNDFLDDVYLLSVTNQAILQRITATITEDRRVHAISAQVPLALRDKDLSALAKRVLETKLTTRVTRSQRLYMLSIESLIGARSGKLHFHEIAQAELVALLMDPAVCVVFVSNDRTTVECREVLLQNGIPLDALRRGLYCGKECWSDNSRSSLLAAASSRAVASVAKIPVIEVAPYDFTVLSETEIVGEDTTRSVATDTYVLCKQSDVWKLYRRNSESTGKLLDEVSISTINGLAKLLDTVEYKNASRLTRNQQNAISGLIEPCAAASSVDKPLSQFPMVCVCDDLRERLNLKPEQVVVMSHDFATVWAATKGADSCALWARPFPGHDARDTDLHLRLLRAITDIRTTAGTKPTYDGIIDKYNIYHSAPDRSKAEPDVLTRLNAAFEKCFKLKQTAEENLAKGIRILGQIKSTQLTHENLDKVKDALYAEARANLSTALNVAKATNDLPFILRCYIHCMDNYVTWYNKTVNVNPDARYLANVHEQFAYIVELGIAKIVPTFSALSHDELSTFKEVLTALVKYFDSNAKTLDVSVVGNYKTLISQLMPRIDAQIEDKKPKGLMAAAAAAFGRR